VNPKGAYGTSEAALIHGAKALATKSPEARSNVVAPGVTTAGLARAS